jgi:hypothetical protein
MNEQSSATVRLRDLPSRFGRAWTSFWFTPSDPIVLSLLRVLVGLVALWWYLSLLTNLKDWFGPEGIFPLSVALDSRRNAAGDPAFAFSLLDYASSASQLWLVYGLGLAAIVMMVCGVLSRISTIAALIFVLSFIQRAPMLSRPVDNILAMLMFYLCLGPSGACFSVDSCLRQRQQNVAATTNPPVMLSSSATVAIRVMQVHLALVYAAMAIAQLQGDKWWQGTAVWWLMARPESRLVDLTGVSSMGIASEYLINLFTYAIVLYELCFAVLIWNPVARPILLLLGIFVWGGLALIGGSVSFCVLMFVATLAFLRPDTLRNWCARCGIEKLAQGKMTAA